MVASRGPKITIKRGDVGPDGLMLILTLCLGAAAEFGARRRAILPAAVAAWMRGWLSVGERITLSVRALTAPILFWSTDYWNLFGVQW
jgi:hypothetical protein